MGGQQGTRKTAPTPRPQTPKQKQPPPPQYSSTPPPVQQPTPVESFISGMGNIADPFLPQAHAQQDIFSTPKPIAKTARHPGSKNVRGAKNQAKIAKAKIALQLAKQKHQQQANIQQQAKFKHAQELAKVEQMYGKDTANAMTGYFEANPDSVDSFNLLPSQVVEKGKWTDGIAALEVTNPMSETPRPKEDKRKAPTKGFQGTRKGDLQKRHIPEFQHPMMNPFLPEATAAQPAGRNDPNFTGEYQHEKYFESRGGISTPKEPWMSENVDAWGEPLPRYNDKNVDEYGNIIKSTKFAGPSGHSAHKITKNETLRNKYNQQRHIYPDRIGSDGMVNDPTSPYFGDPPKKHPLGLVDSIHSFFTSPLIPEAHATSYPRPPPKLEPIESFPDTLNFLGPTDSNKRQLKNVQEPKQPTLRDPDGGSPRTDTHLGGSSPHAGGQHKYFYNEKWLKGIGPGFNLGSERNVNLYGSSYMWEGTGGEDDPYRVKDNPDYVGPVKREESKLPHEIKRQMKNVQISQSGRKTTIGAAGDNYDNTFFEDIRGIPSTFMMYRGTDHERKGTIKEWEKLTSAQQQAEKDWETKSGGTSPVSTDNWTNPWG